MRWSDTKEEASFFGVNYTLPFAHAYRAIGYLGMDRKQAIDRDVYHLARLGINAYRIHLWDVELSDERGNLLENEHLELMDYLLARLEERGIRIIITLQTNFGNGYPERNEPTGGYSYLYDKCSIHRNPEAIAAQERYVAALVNHVNCYTDCSYKEDPYIVGFEINNEPCHTGTVEETEAYINRMLRALKRAGNCKPVFYNVSHNGQVVEAYYATDIQGTTYQWYPTGLVSGHTRRGNCLPAVEKYDIPFSDVKGFDRKARLVYEFDPADVLYTYMYPATVRTLRTAGFQWITQFAYDPIDMAAYNTEYQTHYLNTAYTPGKAVGLMIAAEVARTVQRGEQFAPYPADTLFRDFRVSHTENLTELNDGEKFYYSNCTRTQPKDASRLRAVAGCGSSPVVRYEGTGLYWLDRLEPGVWRLEVMPDVVQTVDPFAKPSLDRKAIQVVDGAWNLTVNLPDLGHRFRVSGLNEGNIRRDQAVDGTIPTLTPGVYLLQREDVQPSHTWRADTTWRNIRLGEYVRPLADHTSADGYLVRHEPLPSIDVGRDLTLTATVAGGVRPDSVLIYTDKVSFWNDTNPYVKMRPAGGYTWQAIIPADELQEGTYRYNLVVCAGNHRQTFPVGTDKSPLDWDYTEYTYWQTEVQPSRSPLLLLDAWRNLLRAPLRQGPSTGTDLPLGRQPDPVPSPQHRARRITSGPDRFDGLYLRHTLSGFGCGWRDTHPAICLETDRHGPAAPSLSLVPRPVLPSRDAVAFPSRRHRVAGVTPRSCIRKHGCRAGSGRGVAGIGIRQPVATCPVTRLQLYCKGLQPCKKLPKGPVAQ